MKLLTKQDALTKAARIFGGMDDSTITTCLQGRCGGGVFADSADAPTAAKAVIGGRIPGSGGFAFLAGDPECPEAAALAKKWEPAWPGCVVIVPENERWCGVVERAFGEGAKRLTRYATSQTERHFDRAQLERWAASLPEGFTLRRIDRELYERCRSTTWAIDGVANFSTAEEYEEYGLGFACLCGDELAGVISTYSSYDGGIEIEIATAEKFRRRGIARANAARILLECLDRGLTPHWDAANTMSLALAKQLGFVFEREYPAYFIAQPAQFCEEG